VAIGTKSDLNHSLSRQGHYVHGCVLPVLCIHRELCIDKELLMLVKEC
jgi:hypothetical protein